VASAFATILKAYSAATFRIVPGEARPGSQESDGHTDFIDRHLPRTFRWLLKRVRVEPFLLTHEFVEKALLDELRLHYLHAHQIAVRAERDAVKAAGVSWWAYQRFMKQHEKQIEEETLIKVPASLDLRPYRDEKDYGLLQRLVRWEKSRR
jgi:hypothetical protein